MNMSKLSVPQAAERLGVSHARVRQRIEDSSLVAEKIGGRWLVDLDASQPAPASKGRPVSPSSVWWSLAAAEVARAVVPRASIPALSVAARRESLLQRMRLAELRLADQDVLAPGFIDEAMKLSRSSRSRAIHRFVEAVVERDYPALLAWLRNRGSRKLFVAASPDLAALRADSRLLLAGVSHPKSGLEDPRMVEAYVSEGDLVSVVNDHWLESPVIEDRPNVVLHVVPIRPPEIGRMLLAADLAEHGGPREVQRAHELLDEVIDALIANHDNPLPPEGEEPA